MDAKELFQRVLEGRKEIETIKSEAKSLREMATSVGGMSGDAIRTNTNNHSKIETACIKLLDLSGELEKSLITYQKMAQHAEDVIKQIPQERFRTVLRRHYMIGEKWDAVTEHMKYADEKSVYRCHGCALEAARKIMTKMPFDIDIQ